jgi:integrase
MTRVRIKGFQIFKDRHGKTRCYHRKTRVAIDLDKAPIGSAAFIAECERIAKVQELVPDHKAGTLGRLLQSYRGDEQFKDLGPRTKSDYQKHMDYLSKLDDMPLSLIKPEFLTKFRKQLTTQKSWDFANRKLGFLSVVFNYGCSVGDMKSNPAEKVKKAKRPKDQPNVNRPWSDQERLAVLDSAPSHIKLPIALMMYCAIDPADALSYPKSRISNGRIELKRAKTGGTVWWPMPMPLLEILDEAPKHNSTTLCVNSRGVSWTTAGFRASWRKLRLELEKNGKVQSGLTSKGLRHTAGTILAEMGYDSRAIADVLGQKTTAMADHYTKEADLKRKMSNISSKFEKELSRREVKRNV